MDDICRLCLGVPSESEQNLAQDKDVLNTVSSCFKIDIIQNEFLPHGVCKSCVETIDLLKQFYTKVHENQLLLQNQLKNGQESLNKFYSELKTKLRIVKNEINKIRDQYNYVNNDQKESSISNKNELMIKMEKLDFNNVSSDDDCKDDETVEELSVKSVKVKRHRILKNEQNQMIKNENLYPSNVSSDDDNDEDGDCDKPNEESNVKPIERKSPRNSTLEVKDEKIKFRNRNPGKKDKIKNLNPKAAIKDEESAEEHHKCLTCFKIFTSKENLFDHYKIAHESEKTEFNNLDEFIKREGPKDFKCLKCEKNFVNRTRAKTHLKFAHIQKIRPFICNLCGRTYKTASEIVRHARAHGGGVRMGCMYRCGFSSTYLGNLRDHEKRHKKDFKYYCDKCGKGFLVKSWYDDHHNIHTGAKPFVCDLCGIAYHLKRRLIQHQNTVHRQTTVTKKYTCMHCSKPIDNKILLKAHLSDVHGLSSFFLCDICGKTFSTAFHLKSHKAFHLNIRPYSCSTCKKSFTTNYHLKRHELMHSAVKAHMCTECNKSYKQRYHLMKHSVKHHSATLLKCGKCRKCYLTQSELTAHQILCLTSKS